MILDARLLKYVTLIVVSNTLLMYLTYDTAMQMGLRSYTYTGKQRKPSILGKNFQSSKGFEPFLMW